MEYVKLCRLVWIFALISLVAVSSNLTAAEAQSNQNHSTTSSWTESDWVDWWNNIEDLYLSGLEDEGLYWLLRHDLELLEQYEEILGEVEIPPPYSGWSGGGPGPGDPHPPVDPHSSNTPMYGEMPNEWAGLIEAHGLDPSDFGGVGPIPAPPMWVASSIALIGSNLMVIGHPGTKVVGFVMSNAGGIMIIWIQAEDEDE